MASGFDALVDSVLSEIALCGVQGAGSAEFFRFIQKFHERAENHDMPMGNSSARSGVSPEQLGRKYYEQLWTWVCSHPDMRIVYHNEVQHYTLSEFEAAELHETGTSGNTFFTTNDQLTTIADSESVYPSRALSSLGGALRERLLKEKKGRKAIAATFSPTLGQAPLRQLPRNTPDGKYHTDPVFDDPESSTTAPRLYASQGRIWQALTGHGIDLKKVPSMEFILLSLIAARGSDGIPQPDLIRLSGQDKRSVPHRTDELARKGYIVKIPVQASKVRTSLCVHTKFSSQTHFMGSSAQEDVYKEDTFVLSGFVHLLYNTFKDAGIVPTRELRTRMGVPMSTWNKRATQGALIRLDQTGMIKRLSVRKKKNEDHWLTCIRVLRKPRDEDITNLGFRRQAAGKGNSADEIHEDDADGDTLMRDLEADNLEEDEACPGSQASKKISLNDPDRIPPQWTPDCFLANLAFDAVVLGGSDGWDSTQLRDRMVGPFWRRPLESYFTRMTDDWERSQPLHLRHLAIIRDFRNTAEKKFIHYVYRTHGNFQKAVDTGIVHWAGVSQKTTMGFIQSGPVEPLTSPENSVVLDSWGFRMFDSKLFAGNDGSATVSEARNAIVHRRAYGPRWDSAISQEIGHHKINESSRSVSKHLRGGKRSNREKDTGKLTLQSLKSLQQKKLPPILSLTPEQRTSLGLKPHGRLSKYAEKQIAEHRRKTGDPCSLPDRIEDEPSRGGQPPLMTAEERIAAGLPPRGRLGIKQENAIRAQRGLAKLPTKSKKREQKKRSEPTVLSKQQRIDLKWIDHGRLPQDLIEGLRQERKEGIALKDSKMIALYDEVMKAAKVAKDKKEAEKAGVPYIPDTLVASEVGDDQAVPTDVHSTALVAHPEAETTTALHALGNGNYGSASEANSLVTPTPELEKLRVPTNAAEKPPSHSVATAGKRKASNLRAKSKTPKKPRTESAMALDTDTENEITGLGMQSHSLLPPTGEQPASDVTMANTVEDPCHTREMEKTHNIAQPGVDNLNNFAGPETSEKIPTSASFTQPAQPQVQSSVVCQDRDLFIPPDSLATRMQDQALTGAHTPMKAAIEVVQTAPSPVSIIEPSSDVTIRPTSPALMPPNISQLKVQEKAEYRLYVERSSPGLFVNPFMRHKGLRGRPRAAFIATFRLPGLSTLEWFRSDINIVQPRHGCTSLTLGAGSQNDANIVATGGSKNRVEITSNAPRMPNVDQSSWVEKSIPSPTIVSPNDEQTQNALNTASVSQQTTAHEMNSACGVDKQNGIILPQLGTHNDDNVRQSPVLVVASSVEESHPQNKPRSLSPPRAVSGWTAINKAAPSKQTNYESPYASNLHGEAMFQTQHANAGGVGIAKVPTMIPPPPVASSTSHKNNSLLRRPLPGPARPRIRAHTKRTKKQQTIGSALFFRRQIIWDIIVLCKGVFPDQGEIGRPFSKLWDQRHGHVQGLEKPIASTVNETMRNMCTNPDFGIKRMVFQVRMNYKKGPYLTKKAIIAYSHLDANSPEVLKLAHNITNFSLERSQQYFPEEIRHLVDDTALYYPLPRAPKDDSIFLNPNPGELEENIKDARKRRRKIFMERKRQEAEARKVQNMQVEQVPNKKRAKTVETSEEKRTRLASLNNKTKNYGSAPPQVHNMTGEEHEAGEANSVVNSGQSPALNWTKAGVGLTPVSETMSHEEEGSSEDDESEEEEPPEQSVAVTGNGSLADNENVPKEQEQNIPSAFASHEGNKRARSSDHANLLPNKKARYSTASREQASDLEHSGNDPSFSSEAEAESDKNDQAQTVSKPKICTAKPGRQRGKAGPLPTLLERLTGLTGDPNDPVYLPPDRKRTRVGRARPWPERKKRQRGNRSSGKKPTQTVNDIGRFKQLCCTLVIASSMSGEEGVVDWNIVEKAYSSDRSFDALKTKKLWEWMKVEMSGQVSKLTANFQTTFLEAYENSQVAPIEDPNTYDWASLVKWATQTCADPEIPLPLLCEALQQFVVDESSYEILDRKTWYKDRVADRSRTLIQLQHSFVSPLHRTRQGTWSSEDKALKARSWIRANTATPQAAYNGKRAHDKLMMLGENALASAVGDFVQNGALRMRKLKRLLPGRNYSFTRVLARKYGRPFDLDDFMTAVKVKKEMDIAFSDEDPSKRFYSISHLEEDGSVAAILSMVSEGSVKFAPQLPAIVNKFGAPLPRISVWGFCEGDYIHRAIDRDRLFWDIYIVPTAKYQFGNPLQPTKTSIPTEPGSIADWSVLPEPPLPGKHDPDALLPIWSSIDGQSITWPWWYRILNLVMQPLIFQPGATSLDIYSHCATHTTELFEVELVLDWLESVNAVRKMVGGGYIASLSFWAVFGDRLRDIEDDWLGEQTNRKKCHQEKQQWREQYNMQHSMMQTKGMRPSATNNQDGTGEAQRRETQADTTQEILQNPRRQYRIMQDALENLEAQDKAEDKTTSTACPGPVGERPTQEDPVVDPPATQATHTSQTTDGPAEDTEMPDADADVDANAEGEEIDGDDIDAEGEVDDTLY